MDFEQMQQVWSKMDTELQKQKKMTDKLILQMTQEKYSNKFSKLATIETIGAFVCFIAGLFLLLNFYKLETWYLMLCGGITIGYLFAMPLFVLRPLYTLKKIKIDTNSFADTLQAFSNSKRQVLLAQRVGMYLNFLLFLFMIPTINKMFNNKDMFMELEGTTFYITIAIAVVAMILISRWGYKCYKSITNSAENILNDLDMD